MPASAASRPAARLHRAAAALLGLGALGAAGAGACSSARTVRPPLPPVAIGADRYGANARELTADEQVRHALARLTFGARPGDAERVRALGVDRWIDQQLAPERIPDPAARAFVARFPSLGRSGAELLAAYPPPGQLLARRAALARVQGAKPDSAPAAMLPVSAADSVELRRRGRQAYQFVGELQAARVGRAVVSERQLQEVMTDFWLNHFSVFAGKSQVRYFLPAYEAAVRDRALGRFRDLLGAVAHSPAMLLYLDNARSTADPARPTLAARPGGRVPRPRPAGINENYARELLELHTLGVDGGYTQGDVGEVARALTGWSVAPPALGGGFVFRPATHDAGEKRILGTHFPAGRGADEGERVLDLLARHPSTARHLARKLAVRFVSDTPPPALVERAAATFRHTDGDVRATLATILHGPEFFARSAYRAKVKTPLELVASAARALGAAPDPTPRTARLVARLGQPLYGRQSPDGWPEQGAAWMNAGAILGRINFGAAVAAGGVPGVYPDGWPAAPALRTASRSAQIDGVIAALLGGEASPDTRAVLARGENPLAARAGPAETGPAETGPADAGPVRRPGTRRPDPFAQLVALALGAPEFQRR